MTNENKIQELANRLEVRRQLREELVRGDLHETHRAHISEMIDMISKQIRRAIYARGNKKPHGRS